MQRDLLQIFVALKLPLAEVRPYPSDEEPIAQVNIWAVGALTDCCDAPGCQEVLHQSRSVRSYVVLLPQHLIEMVWKEDTATGDG